MGGEREDREGWGVTHEPMLASSLTPPRTQRLKVFNTHWRWPHAW